MDGTIRAVQILPNKVLTEVGRHTDGYPIDCMRLTHDRQFMVTSSQDHCKFWPLSDIPKFAPDTIGTVVGERDDEEEEVEEGGGGKRRKRKSGGGGRGNENYSRVYLIQNLPMIFSMICYNHFHHLYNSQ
ncbi:WD repeat-containing protein 55 [Geodia barretti]|uniref:WD repeat-containing protein 55 n=1 Tax=Geodia barretti TaxID=519541 RepID=A0AA35XIH5_GEOBA|nr:WD repeat-containing protein 55 [Geodia barretti]